MKNALNFSMQQALTVSQLTNMLKTMVEGSFYSLTLEGEISGFKLASPGHWYFSLKDQDAVINANMWRSNNCKVQFSPKDGQKVIVTGAVSIYPPRGSYSFNCITMRLSGEGDILAKLEERKKHYAALGYFDEKNKKKIPMRPSRVAVVTSPTGAALQDILQITGRRAPSMNIIILPALVQGEGAGETISRRIDQVNIFGLADVIIVGRGGGSIEDLLPFSEDCVIESIHKSEIPVISAVGHEIDWAISDFAADLRAPTPSAAAELVCEDQNERLQTLSNTVESMVSNMEDRIEQLRLRFSAFSPKNALFAIQNRIFPIRQALNNVKCDMEDCITERVDNYRVKFDLLQQKMEDISPKSVLERGYSIVTDAKGKTIKNCKNVATDDNIKIILNNGKISAKVTEVKNG